MYKIQYLPLAKIDIEEIIFYISDILQAPKAAMDLLNAFDKSIERLQQFPFSCKVYTPCKPLASEYRLLMVKNYAVFYVVYDYDVEVHRVVYSKMDLTKIVIDQ